MEALLDGRQIKGIPLNALQVRPPPFYGEISAHREDTCCGVRIKAKGRKCVGGGLVEGEIDKIKILL
jgi:hypothetical protein